MFRYLKSSKPCLECGERNKEVVFPMLSGVWCIECADKHWEKCLELNRIKFGDKKKTE